MREALLRFSDIAAQVTGNRSTRRYSGSKLAAGHRAWRWLFGTNTAHGPKRYCSASDL